MKLKLRSMYIKKFQTAHVEALEKRTAGEAKQSWFNSKIIGVTVGGSVLCLTLFTWMLEPNKALIKENNISEHAGLKDEG